MEQVRVVAQSAVGVAETHHGASAARIQQRAYRGRRVRRACPAQDTLPAQRRVAAHSRQAQEGTVRAAGSGAHLDSASPRTNMFIPPNVSSNMASPFARYRSTNSGTEQKHFSSEQLVIAIAQGGPARRGAGVFGRQDGKEAPHVQQADNTAVWGRRPDHPPARKGPVPRGPRRAL